MLSLRNNRTSMHVLFYEALTGYVSLLRRPALERSAPLLCRSFTIYVQAIHSAFFNIRRDRSDCSDFRRRFQLDSVRVALLVYLNFWRQNDRWIILMKSYVFAVYSVRLTDGFIQLSRTIVFHI